MTTESIVSTRHVSTGLTRTSAIALVALAVAVAALLPEITASASMALMSAMPKLHVATVTFAGLVVQALPYVLVGAVASATVSTVMTPARWARVLPANKTAAVAVAAVAGAFIPTCECSSVPLAKRMMASGVAPGPAVTFMVAAPSLNPLVVMATLAAFGGWQMASARFAAGLLAVLIIGATISAIGTRAFAHLMPTDDAVKAEKTTLEHDHQPQNRRWISLWAAALREDAVGAATFLVVGGAVAAIASSFIPASALVAIGDYVLVAILVMAALAVIASLCSLGDAFVAASMVGMNPAAMLAFMVVGPIIDLKLAAMMEGVLGPAPARIIAGVGLVAAVGSTVVISWAWGWL